MEGKNNATLLAILGALGALFTVLGTHGAKALEALAGVPALAQAWAAGLPFGLWSSALAFVLSLLVWASAMKWLPMGANDKAPLAASGLLSAITGVVITLSQLHVLYDPDAGQILNAMYLGLGAGLAAPFVGAFLRRQGRQGRKEKD